MTAARISVVIPTHNRKDLLCEMLEALGRQTIPLSQLEVIVVPDGCTDGTAERLAALQLPFTFRVEPQEQSGPSTARNRGAHMVTGDILVFMDDDLLPLPDFLERHLTHHAKNESMVVLGRFLPAPDAKKNGWHIWEEQIFEKHYKYMQAGRRPPAGRRLYSGNFSMPRTDFLASGGFDERLKRGEDVELGFRLEKAGVQFIFEPNAATIHRGFRSFDSWCNSAYLYGKTDVQLARERGHQQVLPEIRGWYRRLRPPFKQLIGLTLDSPALKRPLINLLRWTSGGISNIGLHSVAHYGYSGIYKLQYWHGVAYELGGSSAFRADIGIGGLSNARTK